MKNIDEMGDAKTYRKLFCMVLFIRESLMNDMPLLCFLLRLFPGYFVTFRMDSVTYGWRMSLKSPLF